jgi:DNA-directed RNA polymerase specialized sigma24 family protein
MKSMLDAKHKSSHISGMNKLPPEKRALVLSMLCEGSSMQSIARVLNVSYKTILKLLKNAGEACAAYLSIRIQWRPPFRFQLRV